MSITAIPLIIGIGIDNGIHLVRRYLENERIGILVIAKASGAALIQSNLTTIVGFGALMASSFTPLAEMGLVTSLGVALALVGGLWADSRCHFVRGTTRALECKDIGIHREGHEGHEGFSLQIYVSAVPSVIAHLGTCYWWAGPPSVRIYFKTVKLLLSTKIHKCKQQVRETFIDTISSRCPGPEQIPFRDRRSSS